MFFSVNLDLAHNPSECQSACFTAWSWREKVAGVLLQNLTIRLCSECLLLTVKNVCEASEILNLPTVSPWVMIIPKDA